MWGPSQEKAFTDIKNELSQSTVLTLYDPAVDTTLSADASSFGLRAVLLQKTGPNSEWKLVAYASYSMSKTECWYTQIKKLSPGLLKNSPLTLGKRFATETDHNPLVPLLSTKKPNDLPPRILPFHPQMMRFDYSISHIPRIQLHTPMYCLECL